MRLSALVLAAAAVMSASVQAETYQMGFGPVGHVQFSGKQFGDAMPVGPSKAGEPGDNFVLKNVEYQLGAATLTAAKVGAYSTDDQAPSSKPEALTRSFFFANPNNPDVGAVVELKLAGCKATDTVKFEFIRSNQPFDAHVIVTGGEKKIEKDITSDGDFTEVGTLTGSETYTIQITHLADKPAEADISGARISITSADEKKDAKSDAKPAEKPEAPPATADAGAEKK